MGETAESLFRRGAISPKQASKLGVLKKTKIERPDEEPFENKAGRRDQGGNRDRGHKVADKRHIDRKQDMGSSARASGEPSKGGRVNAYGQPGTGEINDRKNQVPEFPRAGGSTRASKGGRDGAEGQEGSNEINDRFNQRPDFPKEKMASAKTPTNPRSKGRIAKRGGQYGGGGRNTQ